MLQTEEVDDDYFTPVAGTSLANIFGSATLIKEKTENDCLKYTPSKPQDVQKKTKEEKATQCVFACALIGHEWSNNVYNSRGKLGFAIIRIQSTGYHNMVLYDSNKTTLSCTTISPKLEISVRNKSYISYYDNLQKYWSIYAAQEETEKIVEILSNFGVIIKYPLCIETGPPEPKQVEPSGDTASETNIESDSSVNIKTKSSILNRMANMGQSVLPTHSKPVERTSDSSDTNETDNQIKMPRHKVVKNIAKRYKDLESNQVSNHNIESQLKSNTVIEDRNTQLCTSLNKQFLPLGHTSIITSSNSSYLSNEMSVFMTEQRISNSELRINMNRITDKLDIVLNKVDNSEQRGTNMQTDILMKLLNEYEKKIKMYENMLNAKDAVHVIESNTTYSDVDLLKSKIQGLELEIKDKSYQISELQNEIKQSEIKFTHDIGHLSNTKIELLNKISELENIVAVKDLEFKNSAEKCDSLKRMVDNNETKIENKLKSIMNDTYQTISVNFENSESYSGEAVKKIIGAVIKKITIQTLSDL